MEPPDAYEQPNEQQQDQADDDWLAGARIDARTEPFDLGNVQIALSELNLPDGDDGTRYA